MIVIIFQRFFKLRRSLLVLSSPQIGQPHQIIAVGLVLSVQIIVEDQEIRQRDREIIDPHLIPQILLAVIHQLVEACMSLPALSQLLLRKPFVENHIRRLVIIIHHSGRLIFPELRQMEAVKGFFCFAEVLFHNAQIIVDIIILRSLQPPLSQVLRIGQAAFQQFFRFRILLLLQLLLRHLKECSLILGRDLPFRALPRSEGVGHDRLISLFMHAEKIAERHIFDHNVVPHTGKSDVLLIVFQPRLEIHSQFLIELVQLKEHSRVCFIQDKRLLHLCARLLRLALLIVVCQGKVPVHGGELRSSLGSILPQAERPFVLQLIVVQIAEIIVRHRPFRIQLYGAFQHGDILQLVREAVQRRAGVRSPARFFCRLCLSQPVQIVCFIICKHRIIIRAFSENRQRLFQAARFRIVPRSLEITLPEAAHQDVHLIKDRLTLRADLCELKSREIVKRIYFQILLDLPARFFCSPELSQDHGFQAARFDIMCIFYKPFFYKFESLFIMASF